MIPPRGEFIRAMRGVASSVSVVTTDGAAGRHGATVSAFCSVSADPPSVLICLRTQSRIARTVLANRAFCVNVLRASAKDVADRFAGCHDEGVRDRFAGLIVEAGTTALPVLSAAASVFACALTEAIPSGSHLVLIGRVEEVWRHDEQPLTYIDGGYASLSHQHAAGQR